jgi:hypothetical protein
MLKQLANKSPETTGMKLSRFDKVLGLNRKRIASVYRGERVAEAVDDECQRYEITESL